MIIQYQEPDIGVLSVFSRAASKADSEGNLLVKNEQYSQFLIPFYITCTCIWLVATLKGGGSTPALLNETLIFSLNDD